MLSLRRSQLQCSPKRMLAAQPVQPLVALIALVFAVGSILGLAACAGYTSLGSNKSGALTITTNSVPNGAVGTAYSATLTASGGTNPYSWTIGSGSLPSGVSLSSSGTISGTPSGSGNFSFTAKVTDSKSATATQALSMSVSSPGSPSVTTSSLPGGTVGASYSATLQATGGKTPYTWSVSSGSLPAGLNLNSGSGAISGTPTASGTSTFTAQVKDANNNTGSKQLSIAITASGPQPLTITSTAMPQASTANPYSQSLTATGGTSPYTWSISSGSLPPGLSLTASSGLISGQATSTGTSNFTAKVTDSASPANSATQALSITVVTGVALDQYGGRTDIKCANATGWFHTEQINKHWWLCTPLGNAFYANGVGGILDYLHGAWDPASVNSRIKSFGFNMNWECASFYNCPIFTDNQFPVDSNGINSNPVKMPFVMSVRAAYYSMSNRSCSGPLLTNPVKNMLFSHSSNYTGWVAWGGMADYFDTGIGTWVQKDIAQSCEWTQTLVNSPYANYLIGIVSDDGDEMNGFGADPHFASENPNPPGNFNMAMMVAGMSPLQTADNANYSFVYADTLIHSKKAWRDYVAGKYSTVSALNNAWGSAYTTFDSSGTCVGSQPITCAASVSADSVGTGSGATLVFAKTLSHTTVSEFSLQILVNGTAVGGDAGDSGTGTGVVSGPTVSGTVNYATGALALTFTSAPPSGAAITATYVANGWGIGSGLLDEDARSSHTWMGQDWWLLSGMNTNMAADINAFYEQLAAEYLSTCRTPIKALFPNVMFLGPDSLITYDVPSPAPVLQAAGQYLDAFITAGDSRAFSQQDLDFIAQNYGNKPYFGSFYTMANPDSEYSGNTQIPSPVGFSTQAARGQAYLSMMQTQLAAHTTAGDYPYIGVYWFDYQDGWADRQYDWGLVTTSDNALDGHEAVTATVACSAPISQYTCGGEAANYGDLIGSVKQANTLWLGSIP